MNCLDTDAHQQLCSFVNQFASFHFQFPFEIDLKSQLALFPFSTIAFRKKISFNLFPSNDFLTVDFQARYVAFAQINRFITLLTCFASMNGARELAPSAHPITRICILKAIKPFPSKAKRFVILGGWTLPLCALCIRKTRRSS